MKNLEVSSERYELICQDISTGSEPAGRFYILVAVSTMIAGFGLATNSTAVIIGAMLVAPLMMPIFGIALALIQGDTMLLGRALRAEVAGVFAAVLMGYVLGIVYPYLEPTTEMLSRTRPQLFDLFVAIFAGFAGAYAIVDEKISPALPGVAIATAIVPPLANSGLCFAVGAYAGGVGSFLLFFANFISILVVSSITFWLWGMADRSTRLDGKTVLKRFTLPVIAFVFMAIFLTNTMFQVIHEKFLENRIETLLSEVLTDYQTISLDRIINREHSERLHILANVRTTGELSPRQVSRIEKYISEALEMPAELIIRNSIAKDVSPIGSYTQVAVQNLDGSFISQNPDPLVLKTKKADTVIRHYLADHLGSQLHQLRIFSLRNQPVLLATMSGFMPLSSQQIVELERKIRNQLDDPELYLIIRYIQTDLSDKNGPIRYEWSTLGNITVEQKSTIEDLRSIINNEFGNITDLYLSSITHTVIDAKYHFFLEVTGPHIMTPDKVAQLEQRVAALSSQPVTIQVWSKPEAVITSTGYNSYEKASSQFFQRQAPAFKEEIENILERSNL